MAGPLVATKLYPPKLRPACVRRPRLSARLHARTGSRLILISAPAGFGKTTLLAEWLADTAADGRSVAWLSLDRSDDEPGAFWSNVVAALEAAGRVGPATSSLLQAGEAPGEALLAALLNELGGGVDLVLDDYHLVERPEIHAGVGFLVERLPPDVRLVISTRVDPNLPLARLRAQGELTEIRSADLRFGPQESASYLNGTMGLGLTAGNVADLEARTEGWIAALQLAALSLGARDDRAAFIAGFAGSDRYIFDYLAEEVLQHQAPEARDFLLRTCFLDRLSGPLCDAVLEQGGSGAMLERLHRRNLFVVPLDEKRRWYRYHHLFAEVLEAQALDEPGPDLALRHRRASRWYEAQGERAEAIRHALAGRDFEHAADMIAQAIPDLRRKRQEVTLRDWLMALPDTLVRARPDLGTGLVGALLANGEFAGVEDRLLDAERALAARAPAGEPAPIGGETERLPSQIAMYRAAVAQVRGDVPAMLAHAQRAREMAASEDHLGLAAACGFVGIAHWTRGELDAAFRAWSECYAGLETAGHVSDARGVTTALADIAAAQGRLGEVARLYERALRLADGRNGVVARGLADIHTGSGTLSLERGDIDAARKHLAIARDLGEHAGLGPQRYRWCVAMAGVLHAEGDVRSAFEHLAEAERAYVADFFPDVRPVAAVTARLVIATGRLAEAARWRREAGVSVEDELGYLREFEHLTLARLLLAEQAAGGSGRGAGEAVAFLDRLADAAERGGRTGSLIEATMLLALAHAARRDTAAAMTALARSLTLAEPEGYVRLYVDAGPAMADLLRTAQKLSVVPAYVRELLAAFLPTPAAFRPDGPSPAEPLSARELDVLRLLRSELDGPAIAEELMVSLNTMRTHTRNIYGKLGVNSRRSAVRRAEELNLLQRRTPR